MRIIIYPKLVFLLVLIFCSTAIFAQQKKKTASDAEKHYKAKYYYEAADIYRSVFSLKDNKLSGAKLAMHQYYYADACKHSYNYTRAQQYYGLVADGEFAEKYPEVEYWYAYCLKHNGKYESAIKHFKEFLKKDVKGIEMTFLQLEAEHELEGCYLALELIQKPDKLTKIIHLGEEVNTKYSDFSPHLVGEKLYYSSLRFERDLTNTRKSEQGQTLVGKIMVANNRGDSRFDQSDNKNLNEKYANSGNSKPNTDCSVLYLTKCDYDNKNQKMICQIYSCKSKGKTGDDWDEAIKLPKNINIEGVTCTHPTIGFDSVLNKEVLYFVSERKGGLGKMDIWAAEILGDNVYGDPYNLGENINTTGEDVSPFFHNTTQSLYFSSSRRPGFGGFDIFHSSKVNGAFVEPVNIGIPLNSAANDLYFIINPDDTTGFFASNRPGSQVLTGESCCNDIYGLKLPQFPPVKIKEKIDTPVTPVVVIAEPEPEPVVIAEPEPEPVVIAEPEPEPVAVVEIPVAAKKTLDDLNNLLPLALYFHNNEPRDLETSYSSTYNRYVGMVSKYKKEHVAQFNKSVQEQISQNIDDFFDLEVKANYEKMHQFFDELIKAMKAGFKLDVAIQGFTSPRATAEYNKALADRRITSVRKDLLEYKDGVLKQYLESGQLEIKELPLGEGKAPEGISDDIDDPRNSIYSVEASEQRKVNFIVVQMDK